MNKNFYLGTMGIIASVSYFNVTNNYSIGLHIGKIYTILDERFETEKDAKDFLYRNFEMVRSY